VALDTRGAMDALRTLVAGVDGIRSVTLGVPAAPTGDLAAWITLAGRGGGRDDRAYGGIVAAETRFVIWIGRTVGTSPTVAEQQIAAAVDALALRLYTERALAAPLGGEADALRIDLTLADNPDYLIFSGTERRIYPVGVNVTQSHTVPL
jgi:hypothetical protein